MRAGFATVDRKTYSPGNFAQLQVIRAGAVLIGSHAFGALLNALGVKAVPYATEDIDIARSEALALAEIPAFIDMLRETGVEFFEVPALNRRQYPTSFKGRREIPIKGPSARAIARGGRPRHPVPELKAHAKGLPYLHYLLAESQEVPVLSLPYGVVLVRVPVPERYAIHKLCYFATPSKNQQQTREGSLSGGDAHRSARRAVSRRGRGAVTAVPKNAAGTFAVRWRRSRAICRLPLKLPGKR